MGLIRTILALVILLILVHVGLVYAGVGQGANSVTDAVYGLGALLESPAAFLLGAVPALQEYLDPNSFFTIASPRRPSTLSSTCSSASDAAASHGRRAKAR